MFPGWRTCSGAGRRPGAAVRVRRTVARPVPLLAPVQVEAILDACARWDEASGQWTGQVRDRLLFAALAETGMRLGELLSTRHCDWHAGRGGTPFVEVVPRQDHPAGVRCKSSRYRRIYISDELERLHSEYVWQLCDAGAHQEVDLAGHFVLVNLRRGQWLAPMRPETVYDKVTSLKRALGDAVPAAWTPHWFRHTHASALQMGRIASDASFGSWREHALPAAQRAGLRCRRTAGPPRSCGDLGFRGPSGSDATMMRLVALRCVHHRCACWPCDASGCSWLRRVHHGGSGGRFAAGGSGAGVAAPGLGSVIATRR